MLKLTNDQFLIEAGIKGENVLLYQVWKELTGAKTFDSYQFKSINILNGIQELMHNLEAYLDGVVNTDHTIRAMAQELLSTVKRDRVLAKDFPFLKNRMLPVLSKNCDTKNQMKGLLYQLRSYYIELENAYDSALIKRITEAMSTQTEELCPLVSQYISRCVDLGWSVQALAAKIDTLKYDPNKDKNVEECLGKIIHAKKQTYSVMIPFRIKVLPRDGKTKEETRAFAFQQLSAFGVETKKGNEILSIYPSLDRTELNLEQVYMVIESTSYDVFSAAHLSIMNLSKVLNLLSFFATIETWVINDISLIVYNTEVPYTENLKIAEIYKTYEYLDSSSKVYRRATHVISHEETNPTLSNKLLSSFSYANLSRASMALEEKYMNIWIALESLCRTGTYENIIDSVLTLVPNALCLRYIYRLVRNFVEDCIRCDVDFTFSTKAVDMKEDNKEKLVAEVITIFRDKILSSELEEKCKVNSLLCQRYGELYEFLTDIHTFIAKIKGHHAIVKWHLNRLYRIRNEIAHTGVLRDISAIRYTEHLYDYLATLISEILRFSSSKKYQDIGEIFAVINDTYEEFVFLSEAKKPIDKTIVLNNLWNEGIIKFGE